MAKINVKGSVITLGTAVAQVKSGSVDLGELTMVDTTTITDETKTAVAGVRESMSGSVTVLWDPSSHDGLFTVYLAKTKVSITFLIKGKDKAGSETTAATFTCADGYITNISAPITNAGDGALECTLSFKGSGPLS